MQRSLAIIASALLTATTAFAENADTTKGRALIERMTQKTGGYDDLKSLRDVEYTYIYRDTASGKSDISTERYIFDGELSWGEYTTHEVHVFPDQPGTPVQGWNGQVVWVTLDGKRVTDEDAIGLARFMRPTNFYWFAMMQKLLDPGTIHTYKGTREHNGVTYDLVELTFDVPEGVPADTYLLYFNPETHLVDRFLFTVVDFGMTDPLLMEVEYGDFGKVMLPVKRRYTPSNWDGQVPADATWFNELMEDIKFGNGLSRKTFDPPAD